MTLRDLTSSAIALPSGFKCRRLSRAHSADLDGTERFGVLFRRLADVSPRACHRSVIKNADYREIIVTFKASGFVPVNHLLVLRQRLNVRIGHVVYS